MPISSQEATWKSHDIEASVLCQELWQETDATSSARGGCRNTNGVDDRDANAFATVRVQVVCRRATNNAGSNHNHVHSCSRACLGTLLKPMPTVAVSEATCQYRI
jgi:hypothetical protein